ncbi:MAG: hypothetical protein HYZ50_02505 [Deltaproteobacteria bacterium]|nr:hypothetical protein [Deltaproteobacteria bacterium]
METKSLRVLFSCCIAFFALIGEISAQAEDFVLYNDFNAKSKLIDPDKWMGFEIFPGGTETTREIVGKQFNIAFRSYGSTTSDTGGVGSRTGLLFTNPAPISAIKATVQVKQFEALGCSTNSQITIAEADFGGAFFNDGTPTPGSRQNDILAFIALRRQSDALPDAKNELQAVGYIVRCEDALCGNRSFLFYKDDLGPILKNKKTMLSLQWDPDNDRFLVQVNDNPVEELPYTVTDAESPSVETKGLQVATGVPNCTTAPRPVAFLEANFDDVMVNASAVP